MDNEGNGGETLGKSRALAFASWHGGIAILSSDRIGKHLRNRFSDEMVSLYGRNRLVRTLLEKQNFEDEFAEFDRSSWYRVELSRVSSTLASSFVQMHEDSETTQFLDHCRQVSDSVCLQLYYDLASAILTLFFNKTCVNGMLGRGVMFVFSSAQLFSLLFDPKDGSRLFPVSSTGSVSVLDLGAGDGHITERYRTYFDRLFATEASTSMQRCLQKRGIQLVDVDDWWRGENDFQLISCLNLIDRHPKPLSLLRQLHHTANRTGALVLLAFVLPWYQYVEYPDRSHNSPDRNQPIESIALKSRGFEAQLSEFADQVLRPIGFSVLRWTRLPYLCEGDLTRSVYWLDDAVLLLKADASAVDVQS